MDNTSDYSLIAHSIESDHTEQITALDDVPLSHLTDVDAEQKTTDESHTERMERAHSEPPPSPASNETQKGHGRRQRIRTPATDRRHKPRQAGAHLFVTLSHWGIVLLLGFSLVSGMRIGWGYLDSSLGGSSGLWGEILGALSPTGSLFGINLISLHVLLSFGLLATTIVYVVYMFQSRASHRLRVTRKDLTRLKQGLFSGDIWRNKVAMWTANLLVYWLSFLFITVLMVTGLALYRLDWGLSSMLGGYDFVRLAHGVVAYLFIPYVVLHMALQWVFGRFWSIFKAQLYRSHIRAGLIGISITLPLIATLYIGDDITTTLTAARIAADLQAPVLDGDPTDPIWREAQTVTIRTVKGVNNPEAYVDISVKALHDGAQVYFQFQWKDPDMSYMRFPLIKTVDGWEVLETAKEASDENVYYEDKLSMYITDVKNGNCAETCHIGVGPHSDRGDKHGVHYTQGEVGDIWHWKSVRTNFMGLPFGEPGFMDDQHFRALDPIPANPAKRFTAGYHADPKTGGGYNYNYVKLDPDQPLSKTYVLPKMLPPTPDIQLNADPTTSNQGTTWWIHKSQGIAYSPEQDTYPVGALIPNMIVSPFEGDRAHVRAQGAWHNGVWTLEAQRQFDTGSKYDVAFSLERPVYLSVATYNRSQTRHSEHIKPIKLVLQK